MTAREFIPPSRSLPDPVGLTDFFVGFLQDFAQKVDVHGFLQVDKGAQLHALPAIGIITVAGEHDYFDSGTAFLELCY